MSTTRAALPDEKKRLRRELRARMDASTSDERQSAGESVLAHLTPLLDELAAPADVALFASLGGELTTAPLFTAVRARGLACVLPRVAGDDLVFHRVPPELLAADLPKSRFGVPEPLEAWPAVPLSACALIVVPGVAFDRRGGRLGYGRGFYDRALGRMRREKRTPAVAVCMDFQVIETVPMDPSDERIDALVTPALGLVWF